MDIRTAICDDELTDREVVSQYLTRWAKEHGHTITLSMFSSAESFLFKFEDNKAYDLLLLDVEMSEINGVELAGRIRRVNREVQIIFISGYSDYDRRVFGFVAERLMDVWVESEGVSYTELPVVFTGKQNWWKKGTAFLRRKFFPEKKD